MRSANGAITASNVGTPRLVIAIIRCAFCPCSVTTFKVRRASPIQRIAVSESRTSSIAAAVWRKGYRLILLMAIHLVAHGTCRCRFGGRLIAESGGHYKPAGAVQRQIDV